MILNCFYSTYYSSNKNFEYYITGLIEGDGIIITPKTLYSEKGKKNYPSIQISFNSKDFPLVLKIQEILGFGSIKKEVGKNAYRYTINNHSGIIDMVNILNGKMRTAKIHSLNVLIDWLNLEHIKKQPINTEPLDSNSWLSGFIEADGHFSIRASNLNPRVECSFELTQAQVIHLGYTNRDSLELIADYLSIKVNTVKKTSKCPQYRIKTGSLKTNMILENYLTNFPLFGSKYLDWKDWQTVLQFFKKKDDRELLKSTAVYLKSQMNNERKILYWDHLQNFYKLI